ncbi:MAG: hypothetical protein Q9169_007376 [Polycauliona sp. 2 TL-2023]
MTSAKQLRQTDYDFSDEGCFNAGVFVVESRLTGQICVQKRYKPEDIQKGTAEFEMKLMRRYRHKNIVKYLTGFIDRRNHWGPVASVYMEHCDRGNVQDVLEKQFRMNTPLSENVVWHIFMQLVNAVAFLQYGIQNACFEPEPRNPDWTAVIHRDIKPDNIFLCSQPHGSLPRVVLGDFGQAMMRHDEDVLW